MGLVRLGGIQAAARHPATDRSIRRVAETICGVQPRVRRPCPGGRNRTISHWGCTCRGVGREGCCGLSPQARAASVTSPCSLCWSAGWDNSDQQPSSARDPAFAVAGAGECLAVAWKCAVVFVGILGFSLCVRCAPKPSFGKAHGFHGNVQETAVAVERSMAAEEASIPDGSLSEAIVASHCFHGDLSAASDVIQRGVMGPEPARCSSSISGRLLPLRPLGWLHDY